jgi:CysZ protein
VADFVAGIGLLLRGIHLAARTRRLMLLGLLPALLSFVALVAAVVALFLTADNVATWATPFAQHWNPVLRTGTRDLADIAIVALGLLLAILVYTQLTLLIGEPFYEAISKRIDDSLGGVAGEVDVPFWRSLPRSLVESVRLLIRSALLSLPVLAIGLIPVVGEVAAPVLGALVLGPLLAVELTAVAFERRGLKLADRRRVLGRHRALATGFGAATFACFLIPFGAIVFMPGAVAGATLLTRRVSSSAGAGE